MVMILEAWLEWGREGWGARAGGDGLQGYRQTALVCLIVTQAWIGKNQ